jgi:zinc protease
VKTITRQDIIKFYERHYRPERAIITVVGDISAADAVASFEKSLAAWQPGAAGAFEYPQTAETVPDVIKVQKPVTQANIILGHRGIARANPDYYALEVMNFILGGGGFGSRLLDNIRTKAGLAYSVGSGFSAPKFPGSFRIVLQTKNETAAEAVALACEEIERIRREPVTEEELSSAQLYLTGSFPLQLDTNGEIASFLTEIEFFNLGADYADTYPERINAVTKEDVMRVASKYLRPDGLSLVVVADLGQAKVGDTLPCRESVPATP